MGEVLRTDNTMILTRTPLRVSFAGGGTDLAVFYEREYGAVLSTAINRYVYVTVKRHSDLFFEPIRVNYSRSEQVDTIDEIENNIVRECLRLLEIDPPIYVSTVGDVPASTGLGGSSSFTVGLLNALHAFRGERVPAGQLAEEACHIEIDVLGSPIGKQDQYAAAFGGMNLLTFRPDGRVSTEHLRAHGNHLRPLFESLLMFWTGHQRSTNTVLEEQRRNTGDRFAHLVKMRDLAEQMQKTVEADPIDLGGFGQLLDDGWQLKRQLADSITNPLIDQWYDDARAAGAVGGKLCGAGGGGFLLFTAPPQRHAAIRAALDGLVEMSVRPESHGSEVMAPFHG